MFFIEKYIKIYIFNIIYIKIIKNIDFNFFFKLRYNQTPNNAMYAIIIHVRKMLGMSRVGSWLSIWLWRLASFLIADHKTCLAGLRSVSTDDERDVFAMPTYWFAPQRQGSPHAAIASELTRTEISLVKQN